MTTSVQNIENLIAELIMNSKHLGEIDAYTVLSYTSEGPDTPTDLTRNAVNITTRHFQIVKEIRDALYDLEHSKKNIFKRLFKR